MRIDILSFEGCPNTGLARERVHEALARADAHAEITMIAIGDAADALARGFLGSPTIRVNGVDAEPQARRRVDYGYMCRTYQTAEGMVGVPSVETVLAAIRECRSR